MESYAIISIDKEGNVEAYVTGEENSKGQRKVTILVKPRRYIFRNVSIHRITQPVDNMTKIQ